MAIVGCAINKRIKSPPIVRQQLYAFLEGISLRVLVFIAVPFKYILHNPARVKVIIPMQGALFLLFIFNVLRTGVEQKWKFGEQPGRLS